MLKLGLPWWLTVLPAGIMGGIAGSTVSVPALRGVRLFYLAIMTLAFGELMRWVYIRWEPVTGGSFGMAVPGPPGPRRGPDAGSPQFYALLVLVVFGIVLTARLFRSRFRPGVLPVQSNQE